MSDTSPIMTVNGEAITSEQIEAEMNRLRMDYTMYVQQQGGEANDDQLREWSEENMVEQILLKQEALRRPFKADSEFLKRWRAFAESLPEDADQDALKEDFELQVRVERLMSTLSKQAGEPSQVQIRAYYDENQEQFTRPEQVDVTHILKVVDCSHANDQAVIAIQALKARFDKGESFDSLLPESDDFEQTHGELGVFPRGALVPEFEEVVFNMKEGDVSDVFLTPFGYHMARLNRHFPEGLVPLEEIAHEIREHLMTQGQNTAIESVIDELKSTADIQRA